MKYTLLLLLNCYWATLLYSQPNHGDKNKLWRRLEYEKARSNLNVSHSRLLDTLRRYTSFSDTTYHRKLFSTNALPPFKKLIWERVPGFDNIAGRSRIVVFDSGDTLGKRVYAGSAGGLFVNDDIWSDCSPWRSLTDSIGDPIVTSIAQDPTNSKVLYIGTGDGYWDLTTFRGSGIFRSADGGQTWVHLQKTGEDSSWHYVQKILVDYNGIVYAATNSGLHYSENGGNDWSLLIPFLSTDSLSHFCTDLEIGIDGSLYAAFGRNNEVGSIWRYTGNTWYPITPLAATDFQRIHIAVNSFDTGRIYSLVQHGDKLRFFFSNNRGERWDELSVPKGLDSTSDLGGGYPWHNMALTVHPLYSNTVYIGGVISYRSLDSGKTWQRLGENMHIDHHNIVVHPNGNHALWATDGGIYFTPFAAFGYTEFEPRNIGLNTSQFYSCDYAKTATGSIFLGGTQDNGIYKMEIPHQSRAVRMLTGDWSSCFINKKEQNRFVGLSADSTIYDISSDGYINWLPNHTGRFLDVADLNEQSNCLYVSGKEDSLYIIEDFFNTKKYYKLALGNKRDFVTAIKGSSNDHRVTYLGTAQGKIYRVRKSSSGYTLQNINGSVDSFGRISSIDVYTNGSNSDTYLLVTSTGRASKRVWITSNTNRAQPNWKVLDNRLLPSPFMVYWGVFDSQSQSTIYLATDMGVWSATIDTEGKALWGYNNLGIPKVRIDQLNIDMATGVMVAASHGRGIYWTFLYNKQ